MQITNTGDADDRLVAAASDVAERVELHTHIMDGDVMRMVEVEEGFAVTAGETIALERGGMHVMFLGLTRVLEAGRRDQGDADLRGGGRDDRHDPRGQ